MSRYDEGFREGIRVATEAVAMFMIENKGKPVTLGALLSKIELFEEIETKERTRTTRRKSRTTKQVSTTVKNEGTNHETRGSKEEKRSRDEG
jgi:hypothetical protein